MADQPFGLAWRAPLPAYQQAGIARLLAAPGVLLADEMGLGKTIQAIGALRVLLRDGMPGPALVVVPSGLVLQWRRQFREWAPELSTCTGPPEDRRGRWRTPAQVYLTSFDALLPRLHQVAEAGEKALEGCDKPALSASSGGPTRPSCPGAGRGWRCASLGGSLAVLAVSPLGIGWLRR